MAAHIGSDLSVNGVKSESRAVGTRARRLRVGFVLPGTGQGGMEMFTARTLRELRAEVDATVIVRNRTRGPLFDLLAASSSEMIEWELGYASLRRARRFVMMLRRQRLDAVCDMTGVYAGQVLPLARLAGIGVRIAFHRRSSWLVQHGLVKQAYAWCLGKMVERHATHILANSAVALDAFHPTRAAHDSRYGVIRNAISVNDVLPRRSRQEVRRELGIPEAAPLILHTGRRDPAKDHETLLEACRYVMEQRSDVHCVLAGGGTEELATSVRSPLKGHTRLHALGARNDVPDLLAAADIYVFPSVTEGCPNGLLEAMVAGLPCIATDIPAIREIWPPAAAHQLVPPRAPSQLGRAILSGLASGEAREQARHTHWARRLSSPDALHRQLLQCLCGGLCEVPDA